LNVGNPVFLFLGPIETVHLFRPNLPLRNLVKVRSIQEANHNKMHSLESLRSLEIRGKIKRQNILVRMNFNHAWVGG
ncbi:MAG: hypothetical protein ACKOS8_13580, partial [Gemmataceae bacterium]